MNPESAPYLIPTRSVTDTNIPLLLNEQQAANYLLVTRSALAQWRNRGVGPVYIKLNGHICYRASDVAAFINANVVPTSGRMPGY